MATTKTTSKLASKYGKAADAAIKAHANDTTTYGLIRLPAGIPNGIAQVSKCYFKEYGKDTNMKTADGRSAAGEYFFYVEGTVRSPKSVATPDGVVPVEGLTTSQVIPFFDTKGANGEVVPQEKHIATIMNIMRQLAGEEYTRDASVDDFEMLAKGIEEAAPYFRFSTTPRIAQRDGQGVKKGDITGVWENWHGSKGLENWAPEEAPAFNERPAPSANGHAATKAPAPKAPEPEQTLSEMLDELMGLVEADGEIGDSARERLVALAVEAGHSEEAAKNADSWDEVRKMIEGAGETQVEVPEKGKTCKYTPPGKDAKKKPYTERDCKIVSVDEENQTVTLKDLTNKAEYKGVSWNDLS